MRDHFRLVIVAKGLCKLPNLQILLKQKSPLLPRNLALRTFGELLIVFSTGINLLIPSIFNSSELLYSASDKGKLFAKNFSKNSNLENSSIHLPAFPPRPNLKVHNISVTPKVVKKVMINLDLPKTSGPDCIPVVVLKKCQPELYTYELTLQYVSERVLFSKLLKGLIGGPGI